MKARVMKRYRDKNTRVIHEPGEIVTISKERYLEINGTAHGVFVTDVKELDKQSEK